MTSANAPDKGSLDPIKLVCWAGIAVSIVWKLVRLQQAFRELSTSATLRSGLMFAPASSVDLESPNPPLGT
jgi:hypothetical protein